MAEIRKYRPASGIEGEGFVENHCYRCVHEKWLHTQREGDKKCEILSNTMIYRIDEPEYPVEWQYNEQGIPICTKFEISE